MDCSVGLSIALRYYNCHGTDPGGSHGHQETDRLARVGGAST